MMTKEKLDHLRMRLETACLGGDVDSKLVAEMLEDCITLREHRRWIPVSARLPNPEVWVLGWIYLPKNPIANSCVLVQYTGYLGEDEPEDYGILRRTSEYWWGNGRYYEKGYVTHWQPLPAPPAEMARQEEVKSVIEFSRSND